MAEAQGGVAGDGAPSKDDFGDLIRRSVHLASELGRRHPDVLQFVGEDFAGIDGGLDIGFFYSKQGAVFSD